MNRREWLQCAMLGAAGLAVDPEHLLWSPGRKKIFIPVAPTMVLYRKFEYCAWLGVGTPERPVRIYLTDGVRVLDVDDRGVVREQ